ncbi:hypothetical protein CNMCM8980_003431 [Aspergillus fumigatiaffinis]|uniref:Uncharacterized protein n=1 Tax=Aspergillus fumigatiaffinis TaxID=340414 RepID=A0A8H4HJI4_9EURO|nr:hypothetical protein CNMCM5878_009394 [Aspergillus fumigatiaffinis]KAF4245712.1 hypothetical protein CNMCM6805_003656 [Aspergillus fumigatiaffinis]KAF4251808.1 hypothetical protein CNMCM8980_003431 [Aspergillus fumigatiaffinis]
MSGRGVGTHVVTAFTQTTSLTTKHHNPGKLEPYASPPLSPEAHWSLDLDPARRVSWDRLRGMDGDSRRMKQHDPSSFTTSSGQTRRGVPSSSRGAADRFRQHGQPSARGNHPGLSQAATRSRLSAYMDYGYTDTAFQGDSLHGDELQPYPTTLREQQRQQSIQQPFAAYESEMVYNLGQQGPTQNPYEVVPQYPARQSAAIDALSSQFAVPQYFPTNEPMATGVPAEGSPYLNPHLSPSAYNQPGPIGRSSAMQPFPATMAEFTPVGTTARRLEQQETSQQQQQQQQQHVIPDSTNLNEEYGRFQRVLRSTFDHIRAGRLVEAGRSLLEISEWLVTNARELGILSDDPMFYSDRLQLWNDFNICWLAVCQRQKDMTQEVLRTGHQPSNTSMLSSDRLDDMGRELIQLCDQMEQHGLVDYQMGIWEEEILCGKNPTLVEKEILFKKFGAAV